MNKSFTLVYGDHRIPYDVTSDPTRSSKVAIHVNPDGSVSVDAPPELPDGAIQAAVQKRARWVSNHVANANQRYAHVQPKSYVSGEQVLYLGRRYMLKVIPTDHAPKRVRLIGNRLVVHTRSTSPDRVKGQVRAWYRVKARDYFARRLDDLSIRLPWVNGTPSFRLLDMTRQWGSCSSDGQIIVNPHLVKAPRDCIDYVLIHELAHHKHHDHAAAFWGLVEQHCPDWRKSKHHLDGLVELLMVE